MSDRQHKPGCELETGDVQTQGHQLDAEPDEEVLYKLIDCLYGSDGEADIAAIDRYLEELDQSQEEPDEFNDEEGLQQFHDQFDKFFEYRLEEFKPARKRRPLARIAIIAATMCIFLVTAQASGWDIIGAIAQWTSEQFAFVTSGEVRGEQQEDATYASLQEALNFWGVPEELSPTKFPDGSKVSIVQARKENGRVLFSASYDLDGEAFYISIRKIISRPYGEIEINDQNVEIYKVNGIDHYLMTDENQNKVMWRNGEWECFIAGDLSRSDVVTMIDSIYW